MQKFSKSGAQLKQDIMGGLQRALQTREQQGMVRGKQEGIKLGEERGRQNTLLGLVKKGYIAQTLADQILKGQKV